MLDSVAGQRSVQVPRRATRDMLSSPFLDAAPLQNSQSEVSEEGVEVLLEHYGEE